jgi:transcription-repair coupling factor (superfamily II helicase)
VSSAFRLGEPLRPGATALLDQAEGLLHQGHALSGLGGDALAFVLARVARSGRWLVVVDGDDRADQLLRALRFFHEAPERIESFPADDNRPYDGFSPDPARVRQRSRTLHKVDRGGDLVVVATAPALLQRVPDRATREKGTRQIEVGATVDRDELATFLAQAGYLATARADEPGRFAIRGDVVDVWPVGNRTPVRIDLFDDEVERLRRLDPQTLAPSRGGKRVTLLPADEPRIDEPALERALTELGRWAAEQGGGELTIRRRQVVEELRAGIRFSGLQDWLPALVPTQAPLEAFRGGAPPEAFREGAPPEAFREGAPPEAFREGAPPRALAGLRAVVVLPDDVQASLRDLEASIQQRFSALEPDERPIVPPAGRYVRAAEVLQALSEAHEVLELPSDRAPDLGATGTEQLAVRGSELGPAVARLQALVAEDVRLALVVKDDGRGERLMELLAPHGLHPVPTSGSPFDIEAGKVSLLTGDLPRGFVAAESGWAFVPISALFGAPRRAASDRAAALWDQSVTSAAQLKVGDAVVHRQHGVGLYRGLVRIEVDKGVAQDFAKLEYRDGDLLFLPVASLNQISRYTASSADTQPALDKLGGQTWARRKGKVRDNLLAMAQDLVRLHAKREIAVRPPYPPMGPRYMAFEQRFPHQETPDQAVAIDAVMDDLSRPYPTDRLICGDVGFGKTEIAMRAAMRVVEGGRQVAVLCPTTVLAHQHLATFRERFAHDTAVTVGMWSRFTSAKDLEALKEGLADGTVDIVVGTTSLLGRAARYADLGMVVIDEEHRFGVKQKDRLKRMRAEVDVLALSATPIPRTLQLALTGVREMSIIATPPLERLAVRTTLARKSESRVRDAIVSEIERGGQAWFVHNRVESIGKAAEQLQEWIPSVRIAVAHGQMPAEDLEQVLVDFVERRHDVLVCTAIVESGVHLPNVNTMVIDRADLLGLAQLYQLRGRVGRGDRRATCLLLTPEELTVEARKRMRVIVENQSLGSGFRVASADLELRGGGNLLGAAQSGNIDQVGYDTWVELVEDAVHHARGDLDRERIDPEVEVPVPAFLPDILIKDTDERLMWYRRLSNAHSAAEIERALDELEGEHGELPDPARNLGDLLIARLKCRSLGIVRCAWLKVRVHLEMHPSSPLLAGRLGAAAARHPKRFAVKEAAGVSTVDVRFTPQEAERPLRYLRWVLAQLERGGE